VSIRLVWTFVLLLLLGGCASNRPDVSRVPSYATDVDARTSLGRVFEVRADQHPGLSGFQLMVTGQTALAMRAALATAAEVSLDLQYYSVGDDLTTDLLLQRLAQAADRGVRVRLLLDDIHPPTRGFARRAMAAHPDIQVRLFNPFYVGGTMTLSRLAEFAFDSERLNRRMHNKLWITDNAVAIIGSRNLGDEYFEANASGNFHDVDMLSVGPIVDEMSRSFDVYWNSEQAVPAQAVVGMPEADDGMAVRRQLRSRTSACQAVPSCSGSGIEAELLDELRAGSVPLSWARAQFVYDVPGRPKPAVPSGIEHGWMEDHPGGVRTERELLIVSPYFVPSQAGLRHLREMRERGVRVAILTNSLASTDSPAAHAGYARHREALSRAGIELYETRPDPGMPHDLPHRWLSTSPSSLHAKVIVQDRQRAIVGSLNQDPRSRLYNTEAWSIVDSPELAGELASLFDEGADLEHAFKVEFEQTRDNQTLVWTTQQDGKTVRFDVEPMTGPTLSLWRAVLGLLIPEHML
jgi:putative cardiolipin synthase